VLFKKQRKKARKEESKKARNLFNLSWSKETKVPPPGGFPIYYVPESRTRIKRTPLEEFAQVLWEDDDGSSAREEMEWSCPTPLVWAWAMRCPYQRATCAQRKPEQAVPLRRAIPECRILAMGHPSARPALWSSRYSPQPDFPERPGLKIMSFREVREGGGGGWGPLGGFSIGVGKKYSAYPSTHSQFYLC